MDRASSEMGSQERLWVWLDIKKDREVQDERDLIEGDI